MLELYASDALYLFGTTNARKKIRAESLVVLLYTTKYAQMSIHVPIGLNYGMKHMWPNE